MKSSTHDAQQLQDENTGLRNELLKFQESYANELEREREQLNFLFPQLLPFGKPIRHLSLLDEKSQLHKASRFKSRSTGLQMDKRRFAVPKLGLQMPEDDEVDELNGNLQTSYSEPIQWEVNEFAVLKSRIRELDQEVDELKQENDALGKEQRKLGTMLGLQPGKQRKTSLESKIRELQQDLCKAREQKNQLSEELSSKTEIIRQLQGRIRSLEQEKEATKDQEMKKSAVEVAKLRTKLQDLESRTSRNTIRQFSRLGEQKSSVQEELQRKHRTLNELTKMVSTLEGDKRRLDELYELEKNKSVQLQQKYLSLEAQGKLEQELSSKLKQENDELVEQYKAKSNSYDQQLASLELKLRQLNKLQDIELKRLYMTLRSEQEQRDEKVTWELLKKAVNELKEEQKSLQAASATKTGQQEELDQERCRLESCFEQNKNKAGSDLQLKMLKIEAELESARGSQESLKAELATKSAQADELEQDKSRLVSCLEQEKDKVGDLQLKMLKIEADLESGRESQESLEAELATKSARADELEQDRSRLVSCLEQEKDKVGDLQLKMLKIQDELDSEWDNQESLRAELAVKTARLGEIEQETCRLESFLKQEKYKVGDSQLKVVKVSDELKLEHSNLTKRLEELEEGKNKQLNEVNTEMRNKVKELEGRISVLEQNNQVMVERLEAVQNEKKTLVVVLRFLRAQVFGLVQKAKSLSNEVDETRKKKEEEVTRLLGELEEMGEEKSRLLTEVSSRIEEKREAIRQLCFSISYMKEANEELKDKLRNFRIKVRVKDR